jgi:hypothetical protein
MIRLEEEKRRRENGDPPLPDPTKRKNKQNWKDFVREMKKILPKRILEKRDKSGQ